MSIETSRSREVKKESEFSQEKAKEMAKFFQAKLKARTIEKGPEFFGQEEGEEMAKQFLEDKFDCIKRVQRASEDDEKKQATDLVAELENGDHLAIQFTVTDNPEKIKKKVAQILDQGAIRLHGVFGSLVDTRRSPSVLLRADKVEWGKSYNRWLKEKKGYPADYLTDVAKNKEKFLKHMIDSLKSQTECHPEDEQIFSSRLKILEKELRKHLKAHKELTE